MEYFRGSITSTLRLTALLSCYLRLTHVITSLSPRLAARCAEALPRVDFHHRCICASWRTSYIVPMSFSTQKSKEILFDLHDKLLSPGSLFAFYEQVYSYSKKEIEIGSESCMAHVFLEGKRRSDQESIFIRKISDLENL